MENWDDIELEQDADQKAREQLDDEMIAAGVTDAVVIWPDERRAYLDSGANNEDYHKLAKHWNIEFDGVDRALVNDALLAKYEELFEQAKGDLQK